jgi:hypothetical protein
MATIPMWTWPRPSASTPTSPMPALRLWLTRSTPATDRACVSSRKRYWPSIGPSKPKMAPLQRKRSAEKGNRTLTPHSTERRFLSPLGVDPNRPHVPGGSPFVGTSRGYQRAVSAAAGRTMSLTSGFRISPFPSFPHQLDALLSIFRCRLKARALCACARARAAIAPRVHRVYRVRAYVAQGTREMHERTGMAVGSVRALLRGHAQKRRAPASSSRSRPEGAPRVKFGRQKSAANP